LRICGLVVGFLSLALPMTAVAGENVNLAEVLQLTDKQVKEVEEINRKSVEKLQPVYEKVKQLRTEADAIRRENMEQFIAILTPEQKKVFNWLLYNGPKKNVKFLGKSEENTKENKTSD